MVFTESVPAQAASWRESAQQSHIVPDLPNRYVPSSREHHQQSLYGDPVIPQRHLLGLGICRPSLIGRSYAGAGIAITELLNRQVSANLPPPTAQLQMEEFGDLSALLSGRTGSIVDTIGSTDELCTPIFDKGPFNYLSSPTGTSLDSIQGDHKNNNSIKMELNVTATTTTSTNSDYHTTYNMDIFEEMANFNNNSDNNVILVKESPEDDRYSYISSPGLAVPEHYDHAYHRPHSRPSLTMNLPPSFKHEEGAVLNTPDVIEAVVDMGTEFNILDLVNNEDITVLSADSDFLTSLTSPSAVSSNPSTPPATVSRKRTRSSTFSSSAEEEEEEEWMPSSHLPAKKRRGRPPKRPESVASEFAGGDVSKYRELRDKNNEASRKSRLKRKIKDREYEQEADELRMRNVRLRAQVEELEKMVSSFRNNLFKILVKK